MPKENEEKNEAADPRMKRSWMDGMNSWIDRVKKEVPDIAVIPVKVDNKECPEEPTLVYKGKRVAWCAPRAGLLWTNYIFAPGQPKEIHKIASEDDAERDFKLVVAICKKLDEAPKKASQSVDEIAKRLENSKSGKIHISNVTSQIINWAKEQGHSLDDKGTLIRATKESQ